MSLSISAFSADKTREAAVMQKFVGCDLLASLTQLSFASLTELASAALKGDIDILLMDAETLASENGAVEFVNGLLQRGVAFQVVFFASTRAAFSLSMYRQKLTFFLPLDEPAEKAAWVLEGAYALARRRSQRPLCIQNRNKVALLYPKDIAYIESDRRILHIFVGTKSIDTYGKLSQIVKGLPTTFVQCHKSFLVNLSHVKELCSDGFVLKSGVIIPVSQQRRKVAKEQLLEYARESLHE
jgi:DNA-binding LytR/AlgR family response regulator